MSVILSTVNNWMFMIYAAIMGIKLRIQGEFRRIRDDESGIEIVQVVIILLIVVIIAAVLWFFLQDLINEWLQSINKEASDVGSGGIDNPR